jgi:hypothetical protein
LTLPYRDLYWAAWNDISSARSDLELGYPTRVCDYIHSGVISIIEAWLLIHDYPPPRGDSQSIFFHFYEVAPKELRTKVSRLLSKTVILDGPNETIEDGISVKLRDPEYFLKEWKEDVLKCIEQAEEFLNLVKSESPFSRQEE